jgi:hypothetical protein
VSCPFECEYLADARKHERTEPVEFEQMPNRDISVSEKFLEENQPLLLFLCQRLLSSALEAGAVDSDVREALEGLIKTSRTLESGIYYDSVPDNAVAGGVFRDLQAALADFRQEETNRLGMVRTRDADVLRMLAFLERLELSRNNGRVRGRAFLDSLRSLHEEAAGAASPASSLILP